MNADFDCGGSGSGCICGAVSGGTVGLGLILKDKKGIIHLTRELHTWFKRKYGVTCCKTIRATNDTDGEGLSFSRCAEVLNAHPNK